MAREWARRCEWRAAAAEDWAVVNRWESGGRERGRTWGDGSVAWRGFLGRDDALDEKGWSFGVDDTGDRLAPGWS